VFDVMRRASWHRFQILTKRSERLVQLNPAHDGIVLAAFLAGGAAVVA
jgi:protein gp37